MNFEMLNFLYLRKCCDTRIIQNSSERAKICSEPAKSNSEAAKSSLKPVKSNQMYSEPAKSSPDPAKSSHDPAKSSWRPVKSYTMLPMLPSAQKTSENFNFPPCFPVVKGLYETLNSHHASPVLTGPCESSKMSTATCIPRRSPIQVLTGLNLA